MDFVRTGSPYAVAPGRVRKADGEPYKVFTPVKRVWLDHGWRAPAATGASTVDCGLRKLSGVIGYPEPIVDHAQERQVALDRYAAIKA